MFEYKLFLIINIPAYKDFIMPSIYASPSNRADFNILVWEIVRLIPPGKVMTYGQIAGLIPPPANMSMKGYRTLAPRWVGGAMAHCPVDVPWQRVVNSQGGISLRDSSNRQRSLLEDEGVEFNLKGQINLDKFQFHV
jgi:methylated-DNA-protein-cysteine methyltransferase-like protein